MSLKKVSAMVFVAILSAGTLGCEDPNAVPDENADEIGVASQALQTGIYNGHTYILYQTYLSWAGAYYVCEVNGGYLVEITSQGENDFVKGLLNADASVSDAWIGATDEAIEGWWIWQYSQQGFYPLPWHYHNWDSGEPNNYGGNENYALMREDGTWNDRPSGLDQPGGFIRPYVCEFNFVE